MYVRPVFLTPWNISLSMDRGRDMMKWIFFNMINRIDHGQTGEKIAVAHTYNYITYSKFLRWRVVINVVKWLYWKMNSIKTRWWYLSRWGCSLYKDDEYEGVVSFKLGGETYSMTFGVALTLRWGGWELVMVLSLCCEWMGHGSLATMVLVGCFPLRSMSW